MKFKFEPWYLIALVFVIALVWLIIGYGYTSEVYTNTTLPSCGNNVCESDLGEVCENCLDCRPYFTLGKLKIYNPCPEEVVTCGDGICDESIGETCDKCWIDCGTCPEPPGGWWCGDGICETEETCELCPQDCSCIIPTPPNPTATTPVWEYLAILGVVVVIAVIVVIFMSRGG